MTSFAFRPETTPPPLTRLALIPDPHPAHPARFFMWGSQADWGPHCFGVWQYRNRLDAVGCNCGLAYEVNHWGDREANQREARRRVKQHVRSCRSRASDKADG